MMTRYIPLLLVLLVSTGRAGEPWRFITLADWHTAEKYTQSRNNPDWFADAVAQDVANIAMLRDRFGGDLIVLPGDSNGGHWYTAKFIKKFKSGLTPAQAILEAGHLCYSGMVASFKKGGYGTLLMAVGDHELGDNPWPVGSAVARCQPQFREAFAREFNTAPDGSFLYQASIGTATSRPVGTPYERTSYALRHKNVLFVTVDVFHQEDATKVMGDQGSVTGTVTGKHLTWLDNVLGEARKDASIKHIIVQAHLPVIYPVRKVNSSGMMMDGGPDCAFWRTLRQHRVDIYFAGEVHANTVTRDPASDLVQVVSRGNFFSNFLTVDVTDKSLDIALHNQTGGKPSDGQYERTGRLVIDKSGGRPGFQADGELAFFDPQARMLHFPLDRDVALTEHPIVGLRGKTADGTGVMIRGIKCSRVSPNHGELGAHYGAICGNVEQVDGVRGKAGRFGVNSRMGVFAMGPHYGGRAVSYALWAKTTDGGNLVLVNCGSIWGKGLTDFLNLNLNAGIPEVMVAEGQRLVAESARLNDGKWHHIAVVMPRDNCLFSAVRVHVDGKGVSTHVVGADRELRFNQAVRMSFGGLGYSRDAFDALPVKPFIGAMDELSVWARSLRADEVVALAERPVGLD